MSDKLSPQRLNDLRAAAEQAWGDDTRHERFIGHPQPSAGQCFVTHQWMTRHEGGHVGEVHGHHVWVSPDKKHVADLTGELFAYPPVHESTPLEDIEPHHKTWRPGPVLYKRSDHPLFRGMRILDDHSNHPRAVQFAKKADVALRGGRVASVKVADLMGPSGFQGPQQLEDNDIQSQPFPMLHDEPAWDPVSDATTHEYQWIFAQGQLHVSPKHQHEELFSHAGVSPNHRGPVALGYVNVAQNHATWNVESNVSLRGLHKLLKDYSDTVGWKFDGMVGSSGQHLHDDFGPKSSMWYKMQDGHVLISEHPLPGAHCAHIEGKTAFVHDPQDEGLWEWAQDFGYKLAEYPGGGDMTDKMKNKENLDVFNRGDTDFQPERDNPDAGPGGSLVCGHCGEPFDRLQDLRVHERYEHREKDYEEIPDGHFPQIDDFDAPLPLRRHQPIPNGGETIAKTVVFVVPRTALSGRHARFATYSKLFGYDQDDAHQFYGAYRSGQLVGYGAVRLASPEPEVLMIDALVPGSGVGSAIMGLIQTHFASFYTHADSEAGERLMRRCGVVNVSGQRWRWSKGDQPKDMIEDAIPFIYEPDGNAEHKSGWIHIGYPGQKTHEIQGLFAHHNMVEGYYEPGGKVVMMHGGNNVPYTTRQFAQLWYHRFPQMEITSVELDTGQGKTHKLAAADVGNYIRTLIPTDQAAHGAYQALRDAGGKVYAVGGAIRDALLQEQPKDIDLMVSGLPGEQVDHILSSLPGRVDLTGKRFGVYRYKVNGQEVEVALPREDAYAESGRGKGVITVDHNLPIEQDLQRRDFTANSMAVDLDTGHLIDPYGGAQDIERNVLRTTHPDSFREDPTRTIRALTMHGRYGLMPDERTRHELETHGHLVRHESPDALNKVIDKMVSSRNPAGAVRLAQETGTLQHFFPEVSNGWSFDQNNAHHAYPLGEHTLHVLDNVSKITDDTDQRLAALYHDVGKPASAWVNPETGKNHYYQGPNGEGANHEEVGAKMVHDRMRALNYPVTRINRVSQLVAGHMFPSFNSPRGARRFLNKHGENADALLNLREADMGGKGQSQEEMAAKTSADKMRDLVGEARQGNAPTDLSALAINGSDLMAAGIPQGPQIGNVLRSLMSDVVENPQLNNRETLLQRAQQYAAGPTQ